MSSHFSSSYLKTHKGGQVERSCCNVTGSLQSAVQDFSLPHWWLYCYKPGFVSDLVGEHQELLMSTSFAPVWGSQMCKAEGGVSADSSIIAPLLCISFREIKNEHKINDCVKPSPPPLADDKILLSSTGVRTSPCSHTGFCADTEQIITELPAGIIMSFPLLFAWIPFLYLPLPSSGSSWRSALWSYNLPAT